MYNFKFSYLSRCQLVSLYLDKIFLPLLKILPCYEAFFGNLIFAIIARMLCGNHLNLGQICQSFDAKIWLEGGTVKVKCLAQKHKRMSLARAHTRTTRSGDEGSNHEASMSPTLSRLPYTLCTLYDIDVHDHISSAEPF